MASKTQTGQARFQRAERRRMELRFLALVQMIPHNLRLVSSGLTWKAEFYQQIQAVEGRAG